MFNDLDLKRKLVDEILSHLDSMQGLDLKNSLDKSMAPTDVEPEVDEMGKPKGIKIESIEVMKKPEDKLGISDGGGDDDESDPVKDALDQRGISDEGMEKPDSMSDEPELSDDELEELLKRIV